MTSLLNHIAYLEELRDDIITKSSNALLLSKHWQELTYIAETLVEACQRNDLDAVASTTRKMKNKLRRRIFKSRLEALEKRNGEKVISTDVKHKQKPGKEDSEAGPCSCAHCHAKLDVPVGQACVEGALCTSCALKAKKDTHKDEREAKTEHRREIFTSKLRHRVY